MHQEFIKNDKIKKYLVTGTNTIKIPLYHLEFDLEKEFPFLQMESVEAKPIFFSKLQSMMGFTGMYFPFTGEANVNIDAPAALFPATVAHEMAHQRMIASELEANFLGVAACLSSDNVTYQYCHIDCPMILAKLPSF